MAISLSDAQTALAAWVAADLAVATGQAYSMGTRTLTRADAAEITNKIAYWSNVEATLQRSAAGESRTSFSTAKFV